MSPIPSLPMMMGGKVSPREIEKLVDRLKIEPAGNLDFVTSDDVRVAAAAVLVRRYTSLVDYVVDMNLYFADAVNKRAQLICFPAFAGFLPVTAHPRFASVLPELKPLASTGMPDIDAFGDALSFFSDFTFDVFSNTMSMLSARHGVYTVAGSALCFDRDELRHRAFLYDNKGDLIGFQDKLSLSVLERELGIEPAAELKVFDTPLGAISILINEDAEYFEPALVAKNLGANILISPRAFVTEQTGVDMALGLNMRVQENYLYGIQSVLVGDTGLGFSMEGMARVFSPNELLLRKNGVISQTLGSHGPDVADARLNLDRLSPGSPYTHDKNPNLMKKYIDRLY